MSETDVQEAKMTDPVPKLETKDLYVTLQDILSQLAVLSERVGEIEKRVSPTKAPSAGIAKADVVAAPAAETAQSNSSVAAAAGISEGELLAISAALAAWLGVHAHIRQIRLIRTGAWAQQGRVTIQTSHRLNY